MRTFYAYPAVLEPGDEPGVIMVSFPDLPTAVTEGKSEAEAIAMGSDALGVMLLALLDLKQALPKPSKPEKGQVMISVAPELAAKLAVIEAFRAVGLTQGELAERLGKDGREVRRILDPDHATKLPALIDALSALGRRLVVGVEAA